MRTHETFGFLHTDYAHGEHFEHSMQETEPLHLRRLGLLEPGEWERCEAQRRTSWLATTTKIRDLCKLHFKEIVLWRSQPKVSNPRRTARRCLPSASNRRGTRTRRTKPSASVNAATGSPRATPFRSRRRRAVKRPRAEADEAKKNYEAKLNALRVAESEYTAAMQRIVSQRNDFSCRLENSCSPQIERAERSLPARPPAPHAATMRRRRRPIGPALTVSRRLPPNAK